MSGITTLFPLTRSITALKTPPKGVNVQSLARTSADSWGETNRADLQRGVAQPDPQDLKGPLTVAAVATIDKARMVVYGTSNIAANQFLNIQGNRDFFLNTVSWLAEEEDQISSRPRPRSAISVSTSRRPRSRFASRTASRSAWSSGTRARPGCGCTRARWA